MSQDKTPSLPILRRDRIVDEARKFLDVPFAHQGRTKRGLDCAGLVLQTGHSVDHWPDKTFDVTAYKRRPSDSEFERRFLSLFEFKSYKDPHPGCMAAFKLPIFPCHCGIVAERFGHLSLIHAYADERKVVEQEFTEEWYSKLVGVYEFKGTEPWPL